MIMQQIALIIIIVIVVEEALKDEVDPLDQKSIHPVHNP
jgi:hypothetical protein